MRFPAVRLPHWGRNVKLPVTIEDLRDQISRADPAFWENLRDRTKAAESLTDVISLATLRRRAKLMGLPRPWQAKSLRIAFLGGYSLYPLNELVEHFLECGGFACEKWIDTVSRNRSVACPFTTCGSPEWTDEIMTVPIILILMYSTLLGFSVVPPATFQQLRITSPLMDCPV